MKLTPAQYEWLDAHRDELKSRFLAKFPAPITRTTTAAGVQVKLMDDEPSAMLILPDGTLAGSAAWLTDLWLCPASGYDWVLSRVADFAAPHLAKDIKALGGAVRGRDLRHGGPRSWLYPFLLEAWGMPTLDSASLHALATSDLDATALEYAQAPPTPLSCTNSIRYNALSGPLKPWQSLIPPAPFELVDFAIYAYNLFGVVSSNEGELKAAFVDAGLTPAAWDCLPALLPVMDLHGLRTIADFSACMCLGYTCQHAGIPDDDIDAVQCLYNCHPDLHDIALVIRLAKEAGTGPDFELLIDVRCALGRWHKATGKRLAAADLALPFSAYVAKLPVWDAETAEAERLATLPLGPAKLETKATRELRKELLNLVQAAIPAEPRVVWPEALPGKVVWGTHTFTLKKGGALSVTGPDSSNFRSNSMASLVKKAIPWDALKAQSESVAGKLADPATTEGALVVALAARMQAERGGNLAAAQEAVLGYIKARLDARGKQALRCKKVTQALNFQISQLWWTHPAYAEILRKNYFRQGVRSRNVRCISRVIALWPVASGPTVPARLVNPLLTILMSSDALAKQKAKAVLHTRGDPLAGLGISTASRDWLAVQSPIVIAWALAPNAVSTAESLIAAMRESGIAFKAKHCSTYSRIFSRSYSVIRIAPLPASAAAAWPGLRQAGLLDAAALTANVDLIKAALQELPVAKWEEFQDMTVDVEPQDIDWILPWLRGEVVMATAPATALATKAAATKYAEDLVSRTCKRKTKRGALRRRNPA